MCCCAGLGMWASATDAQSMTSFKHDTGSQAAGHGGGWLIGFSFAAVPCKATPRLEGLEAAGGCSSRGDAAGSELAAGCSRGACGGRGWRQRRHAGSAVGSSCLRASAHGRLWCQWVAGTGCDRSSLGVVYWCCGGLRIGSAPGFALRTEDHAARQDPWRLRGPGVGGRQGMCRRSREGA